MTATSFLVKSARKPRLASVLALLATSMSLALACSSSSSDGPSAPGAGGAAASACLDGSGPVPGDADLHCTDTDGKPIVQETSAAACMDSGAGGAGAGGAPAEEEETPATLFNDEGEDDDCKYHVSFSSTCIEKNKDVTLTLHANLRSDDSALVGADAQVEIYLSDTHLAPNTHPKTTMVSDGVYSIGPVRFDQSGRWTVRFHLFETCLDARPDSPHGHVAFYVDVP